MAGARDRDDGDTKAMLYEGASISQMTKLFGMDARDVSKKLASVAPCGERRGFPIWKVKEAARVLVKPEIADHDIIEHIVNLNFKDLPAALNKEIWNGLRARLKFEQEQGVLWDTGMVLKCFNTFMQIVRMNYLLLADKVNRVDTLSAEQRAAIIKLSDEGLADLVQQFEQVTRSMPEMRPGIMDFTEQDEDDGLDIEDAEDEVQEVVEDYDDL